MRILLATWCYSHGSNWAVVGVWLSNKYMDKTEKILGMQGWYWMDLEMDTRRDWNSFNGKSLLSVVDGRRYLRSGIDVVSKNMGTHPHLYQLE